MHASARPPARTPPAQRQWQVWLGRVGLRLRSRPPRAGTSTIFTGAPRDSVHCVWPNKFARGHILRSGLRGASARIWLIAWACGRDARIRARDRLRRRTTGVCIRLSPPGVHATIVDQCRYGPGLRLWLRSSTGTILDHPLGLRNASGRRAWRSRFGCGPLAHHSARCISRRGVATTPEPIPGTVSVVALLSLKNSRASQAFAPHSAASAGAAVLPPKPLRSFFSGLTWCTWP